eukprot:gene38028-46205_t
MNGDNELEPSITGGPMSQETTGWINPARSAPNYVAPGDFHAELAVQGSSPDVHVVALVDRSPDYADNMDNWSNTRLYYIQQDDYPDNSRVRRHFPADHTYLSMWDHNWAWHSGYFERDASSLNDTINYPELRQTLSRISEQVDVVGYDACVGSHVEVMHTWQNTAKVYVGSQDYVGWGGVDYSMVISAIYSNTSISPQEISTVIGKSMLTDKEDKCASAVRLDDSFTQLSSAVDTLAQAFLAHLPDIKQQLLVVRKQSAQIPNDFSDAAHRDLYTLAEHARVVLARYDDIAQAAGAVMYAIEESVVYNEIGDDSNSRRKSTCTNGHGISIYWPLGRIEDDYFQTSFALSTHWDEFLSAMHAK